jgi:protein O-mannosyl-transferase
MKKSAHKSNKTKKDKKKQNYTDKVNDFVIKYFNIISFILIALAGIIAYSNSFSCSFHFDDEDNITGNPIVKNLSNFSHINYWLHPGRQIAYLSFALNYHFNKTEVFGYHLINLIIHIITGIFAFLLTKLILTLNNSTKIKYNKNKDWLALFAALFFIVHPLQTQAITYIVQRMASMAAMFYVISIYLYATGRIEHVHKNYLTNGFILYFLAFLSGILGVLSKQNAATFPFAMILFEFFFIRNKDNKIFRHYIIMSSLAIIVLSIIFLIINPTILTSGASEGINISGIDYFINQFIVIVRYLQLTLLPINQCLDYGSVAFNFPFILSFWNLEVMGCFLFLAGLIVLAVYLFKKNKALSYGLLWFFLTLSIESSIIPIADPMYEHRMYLPMLGLGLFLISSIFILLNKLKPLNIFLFLSVLILTLCITSHYRNEVWKNGITLWSDVIKKAPYNARAWSNKGTALSYLKKYEEALKYYDEAIRLKPDYPEAWFKKGKALDDLRKYEEAIKCYDEAIKQKPDKYEAITNKGLALANLNKFQEAIFYYDEAIKIEPGDIKAWNNKGGALFSLRNYEEASKCFDEAIKLNPENPDAWNNKGSALYSLNKNEEAMICYDKALELKQDYENAWFNKGITLANLKKDEEAIKCFDEAIKIKPDYVDAWTNRGNSLNSLGKYIEAINCYDKALEINPNHLETINNKKLVLEKLK